MSRNISRSPGSPMIALAAAGAALVLWFVYALTSSDPALDQGTMGRWIEPAAVLATAFAVVAAGGWAILAATLSGEGGAALTGLQRVLVYAVLGFVAFGFALDHLGFDLRVALATSAVAGLAIGWALQPTLGSTVAGMNLIFDRVIKVGDAVMIEGQQVRVVSLNWRSMIGRKPDSRIVVVPNAKLSDSTVEVLPQNESIRIETQFSAPSGEPPQRIAELVTDVANDLPQVDATRAVTVHPTDVAGPSTRYRLRCWVRRYHDMSEVEGEIQLRLWYVFQRHRLLALPESKEPGTASSAFLRSPRSLESLVAEGLEANGWPAAEAASAAPQLAAQGLLLLFAPGERLALPDDLENWAPMILHGQAAALQTSGLADRERRDGLAAGPASRAAALHAVARELAGYIGPYAERAVNRAAGIARADLAALCRMVAEEIPDEADRNRFLERTVPDEPRFFGAGSLLAPGKDGVGLVADGDPLRAVTELQVLALLEPPSRRKAGSITPIPTSAAG